MKITLIQPPKPLYGAEAEEHWELARPFTLFFLAASIEKYTPFEVQIIDLEHKRYRNVSLEEVLQNHNSLIFGITATTYTRFEAIKIAKYIKKTHPDSWIIVGGVHFMHCAKDTLEKIPEIDVVARGEGEITIVDIANVINKRESFEKIKGITYRRNGQIIENPNQAIFEDLDSIPIYSKFTWDEYPEYLFNYPERVRAISIMSSRGCPYKCIFCSRAGMKYRVRNAKSVVDEIELLKERFNIEGINFLDLTFTANPPHVKAVCQEILNRKIDLKWWCESRANIPLDILDLMKQAGCVSLVVGIESGSPRILSKINKGISIEQVVNFCKKCSEISIRVSPYFMFSHPDETVEDVKQTLDLIYKLERFTATCSFQPSIIFPGTELEKIAYNKGILPEDFSWCNPYESDLNKELEQLVNVPLYIDMLTPNSMKKLIVEKKFKQNVNRVSEIKFKDLVPKVLDSIKNQKPSSKFLFSPRFCYEYIKAKLKS
jgi:anaerobic magnesium-protoporphyrin IX monomethyl ester cyclase